MISGGQLILGSLLFDLNTLDETEYLSKSASTPLGWGTTSQQLQKGSPRAAAPSPGGRNPVEVVIPEEAHMTSFGAL